MTQRLLGIDYGRAHVGLALAITPLAEPLHSVSSEQAVAEINKLVKQHQVDTLVFGLSDGYIGQETREFAKQFVSDNLKVEFLDETLSSQEAQVQIRHKKMGARRQGQHQFAAAIILQNYLDLKATSYA